MNNKAYRVKRINMVKESIHVVSVESDNSILSDGFNDLNHNKHFDDESEEEDANEQAINRKKIMQEPIQSLEDFEEKQVEHIEDSQPNQETNA